MSTSVEKDCNKVSENDNQKEKEKFTEQKKELSTKEAYFASLNEWVQHANMSQNAQALFPWYLMTNFPQMFPNPLTAAAAVGSGIFPTTTATGASTTTLPNLSANNANPANAPPAAGNANGNQTFSLLRLLDEQAQNELINRNGGYEYVIAPFWKRAVAEIIDVILLLLVKILVIFSIMNMFDLDLGLDLDKDTLRKAIEDDDYASFFAVSIDFLALSSDLLLLEILTKIIVCFNEAVWTTMYHGATPGKALMNLKIVYVEAVLPLQPQLAQLLQPPQIGLQNREPFRALLFPAETPNFMRSFMRAIGKNLIMTLLFPVCFIMIFFKNNRTVYDVMTKTVVVECSQNPVLRRQQR